MKETGVVITEAGVVFWHLPVKRSGGSLPEAPREDPDLPVKQKHLWDVLWELRKEAFLGFAHSHPGAGIPGPSDIDLSTFAAIELGLGRRLTWWITSADRVISLHWQGPGEYTYAASLVEEPSWAAQLRQHSTGETT